MTHDHKKILIGAVFVLSVLGLIMVVLWQVGILQFFMSQERLLTFVRRHWAHATATFIFLQVTQVVVGFLPGEVTGFAGGILFGPKWGILYSTVGLTIGSWIAFLLSRHLGRPIVHRFFKRATITHYENLLFRSKRSFLIFLMFLIPGFPKDILCYLLGLTPMKQSEFLIVSTTGRLLGTILLTYGGAFFRQEKYLSFFIIGGVSAGVAVLVWIFKEQIEQWMKRR